MWASDLDQFDNTFAVRLSSDCVTHVQTLTVQRAELKSHQYTDTRLRCIPFGTTSVRHTVRLQGSANFVGKDALNIHGRNFTDSAARI